MPASPILTIRRRRTAACSVVLWVSLFTTAAFGEEPTITGARPKLPPLAPDVSGALYVAESVAVSANAREAFIDCLRHDARKNWQDLKRASLLADVSIFETIQV